MHDSAINHRASRHSTVRPWTQRSTRRGRAGRAAPGSWRRRAEPPDPDDLDAACDLLLRGARYDDTDERTTLYLFLDFAAGST
jgi:hypothetical protein